MRADLALLGANLVYATSYVVARLTLDSVPAAALAFSRCVIGAALLWPFARRGAGFTRIARADHARIGAMGVLGFGVAFALAHWGLVRSTAANAALLIIVEPLAIMALSPMMLGETLGRRETLGGAIALAGTMLVVLDVAGPVQHTVDRVDVQAMAQAAAVSLSNPDARIAPVEAALSAVSGCRTGPFRGACVSALQHCVR